MKKISKWKLLSASLALPIVAIGIAIAAGEQTAPTETKGVSVKPVNALNLATEIEGMMGRQLRVRVATIEPGGVFAVHNHKDRPAIEFVWKGTATEFRGTAKKEIREGESALADKDTVHWWRNDGNVPAVIIVADIFNPPKP